MNITEKPCGKRIILADCEYNCGDGGDLCPECQEVNKFKTYQCKCGKYFSHYPKGNGQIRALSPLMRYEEHKKVCYSKHSKVDE